MKRIVSTNEAPTAIGAYSQATTNGDLICTSGQLPMTPDGELLNEAPVAEQTQQCLENVQVILESQGASMNDILKTTVFLDDIGKFDEFNKSYSEFFNEDPPARSAVEVSQIPKGAAVEIEALAVTES